MMRVLNIIYLLVALSVVSLQIYAATLYGLSDDVALISIQPESYKVTQIGKPLPNILQAQNLASIDVKNGIYYFIGYDDNNSTVQLIGLSLKDGSIVKAINLPFVDSFFIGVGQLCNVDTNSGDVLVVGRLDDDGPAHVMRVNTQADLVINVGIVEDMEIGSMSAFDASENILYFEVFDENTGDDFIYGMDAKSGEIVDKIASDPAYTLETLNYDPLTQMMYGIGINFSLPEGNRRILVSLNQKTAEFSQISVIPNYWIISASIAALDVKGRRLSCFLSPAGDDNSFDLVTVDIDTGKLLYASQACADDADCPWSIEYGM